MRHMEKVWKAEERSKSENKKLSILQQELAEEREMESLKRAHENLTGFRKPDRVEFLYSEPLLNEPSSDDYLLGSKFKGKGEDNDVKNVKDKPGSLWLDQPAITSDSLLDKRAKIREDPLFSIKKEEQNQKATLKNNPVKMKRLREQVLKQKLIEELKKEKKRKRKSEKSEKSKNKKQKQLASRRYNIAAQTMIIGMNIIMIITMIVIMIITIVNNLIIMIIITTIVNNLITTIVTVKKVNDIVTTDRIIRIGIDLHIVKTYSAKRKK